MFAIPPARCLMRTRDVKPYQNEQEVIIGVFNDFQDSKLAKTSRTWLRRGCRETLTKLKVERLIRLSLLTLPLALQLSTVPTFDYPLRCICVAFASHFASQKFTTDNNKCFFLCPIFLSSLFLATQKVLLLLYP